MTRLPSLRPTQVVGALEKAGFSVVRIRGSHYQLRHGETNRRATVPHHNRDLTKATLSSILRQSGVTIDELLEFL